MPDLQAFKTVFDSSKSIYVFLPTNPSQDVVASGLALYLSLQSTGKKISVISSDKPIVRDSHLVGLDKITTEVGGNNLVITFNLPEDAVDKVTSNTEGGHLNLVIAPKKDGNPITEKDLSFAYTGANADLCIVVGANSLSELGAIYEKEIEFFEKVAIVNFGKSNGGFGTVDMADPSSSNAEFTTAVLQELHLPIDIDVASNLMKGIEDATGGLSTPDMTADTFEALAVLYRNGARRSAPASTTLQAKVIADTPIIDIEAKENKTLEVKDQPSDDKESEADWLKPKIMKGSVSTK